MITFPSGHKFYKHPINMACFTTRKSVLRHIFSSDLLSAIIIVLAALLAVIDAAADPFGFDETTGTSISGREFLLAISTSNPQTGAFIKIHNPSADRRTSVQVTTYGQPSPRINSYQVSYSTYKTIRLTPTDPLTIGPFVVNVTASQNITLVAMRNGTSSFGSYTVYPVENAGVFYDIVSFPSANENHRAEIAIIGADDNSSEVTFRSTKRFTVTMQGVTANLLTLQEAAANLFTLSLEQNGTICVATGVLNKTQMAVIRSDEDLTGSTVVGSAKGGRIIVISGSYCPNDSCDILMEQMPPIQTLGKSYFIVPTSDYQGSNCFRILAPWDNTTVTTGSLQAMTAPNTQSFTLEKGTFFDIDLPGGSLQNVQSIKASNPILLVHYLIKVNNNDVAAMTIIPPVEQFASGNVSFTPYNDTSSSGRPGSDVAVTNLVNIVTICDNTNFLRLNRQPIPAQSWKTCPPFDDPGDESIYCATQIHLTKKTMYTLEPDSRKKDMQYSAVQYGVRTDQSAFANTVFMSFVELTCDVEKGGVVIPCKSDKTPTLSPTTETTDDDVLTTTVFSNTTFVIETTVVPSAGNSTNKEKSTGRRQKAGTILAVVIGVITLIAGIVALALIANAACGKRSKWKRLHNPAGTDSSITLDSVSV